MAKRIFLLDGSAIAYRSHFAFGANPLTNKKGMDTSACFGFANTLFRIRENEKPDYMAVVFDSSEPTFRHEKYAEYKATREKMPDELREQLPIIQDMVEAMRIPFIKQAGLEADDIIGTLAYQAHEKGLEVYMVTGDKDFMQLLKPNIYMYSLKKKSDLDIMGSTAPEKKWGVPVKHVTDMLALMGDSSDNVPGVPGIGEKTASKLIQTFGGLDEIYKNIDDVKPQRIQDKLIEFKDQAYLCKELVTILTDAKLPISPDELITRAIEKDRLKEIFQELEFSSLMRKIGADDVTKATEKEKAKPTPAKRKKNYNLVVTEKQLQALANELNKAPFFALDTETTGLDPISSRIIGISFSTKANEASYLSFAHADFSPKQAWKILQPILEDASKPKGGQNIKYDRHILRNEGIHLRGISFDTMIASYLLDPNNPQHGLDALALKYLNIEKIPTEALIGKGKKQISMTEVDINQLTEYACEDADVTFQLQELLQKEIEKENLASVYSDIEIPLAEVLGDIERNGITISKKHLEAQSRELQKKVNTLEKKIHKIAGKEFNIKSPKQMGPILFEELKIQEYCNIKKVKKTKTGYATDHETLTKYIEHPIVASILEYRNLTKLISTYIDSLPTLINEATGKIHTSFNQTVAATGRLSSSDPNLQNIPIRTEEGKRIREAFVASEKNWKIVSADYSQIELRLLAHLSNDDTLIDMFTSGQDVHTQTASKIFDIPMDKVTPDQRARAKTINFGIIYGMGPQRLARENKISLDEAKQFIENYFATFSKVQSFFATVLAQAETQGFVTTLTGRKRPVDIKTKNPMMKAFAERIAINTPLQGSAADLIKIAMIDIQKELLENHWKTRMLIQVHDELVFECPEGELKEAERMIRQKMSDAMKLQVPLIVDVGVGANWSDAH